MKTLGILIPTYKRFEDLKYTLHNTPIDERAKFIIVANLNDEELTFIKDTYGDNSIIVDERQYGKLGGCKAYNLAFEIAQQNNFDYAMLYADDIIPFESNWLDRLFTDFIDQEENFGIFSTDECHEGYYGYNIVLDCPIAHFFIVKTTLITQLFPDTYMQYAIDFEISLRLKSCDIDIKFLPIRLNHLRSGLHREFMELALNSDIEILLFQYPRYQYSVRNQSNLYFFPEQKQTTSLSTVEISNLKLWPELPVLKGEKFKSVWQKFYIVTLIKPLLNFFRAGKRHVTYYYQALFLAIAKILPLSHNMSSFNCVCLRIWKQTALNLSPPFFIDKGFDCLYPRNITIGKYVSLGHYNRLWAFQKITIGDYTQTAIDLLIVAGSHQVQNLYPAQEQEVNIGAGCWIGARVTIIGGVNIGKGVIVGAGAVVINDIPDFSIVVGVPAKVIKTRTPEEVQWNPFKNFNINDLS